MAESSRVTPEVSVVTPYHGPAGALTRLLRSLEAQSFPLERFEWIVVDDASPGGPPDWFSGYRGPLRLQPVPLRENVGRALARNAALERAKGEVVAFLDGDMEAAPRWLEALTEGVRSGGGVAVGRRDPHPAMNPGPLDRYFHSRGAVKCRPGERIPGRYFTSANSAMPMRILQHVGGFDPGFRVWGGEDQDLGFRLQEAGVPIIYQPGARALHDHPRSWRELEEQYLRYGREALPVLLDRHPWAAEEISLHYSFPPPEGASPGARLKHGFVRFAIREPVYRLVRSVYLAAPRLPWPDILFDYMVFSLYARGYKQAAREHDEHDGQAD